jgi:SagB-type dehydrogenase family enzyme
LAAGNSRVDEYGDEAYLITTRPIGGPILPLPAARAEGEIVEEVLTSRRSCRRFAADSWLELPVLGKLLGVVAGSVRGHRTYPSAGGLYPVEIIVGAMRVTGVEAGASLRYDPGRQVLTGEAVMPPASWLAALPGLGSVDPEAVLLLIVDLARPSGSRYAERGYRLACVEAGHLAQNLMIVATRCELGSLGVGAIAEEVLARGGVLGHVYEVVVYAVAIGRSAAGS